MTAQTDTQTVTTRQQNLTAGLTSLTFVPRSTMSSAAAGPNLDAIPDAVWQHVGEAWDYFNRKEYDGESILTVTLPDEATAKQWAAQFTAAARAMSEHTKGKVPDLHVRFSPLRGEAPNVRGFRMRTVKDEAARKEESKRNREAAEAAKAAKAASK